MSLSLPNARAAPTPTLLTRALSEMTGCADYLPFRWCRRPLPPAAAALPGLTPGAPLNLEQVTAFALETTQTCARRSRSAASLARAARPSLHPGEPVTDSAHLRSYRGRDRHGVAHRAKPRHQFAHHGPSKAAGIQLFHRTDAIAGL